MNNIQSKLLHLLHINFSSQLNSRTSSSTVEITDVSWVSFGIIAPTDGRASTVALNIFLYCSILSPINLDKLYKRSL